MFIIFQEKLEKNMEDYHGMVKNCGCGWTKEFLEAREITCDIHHLNPKRDGGDDSYGNLTAACPNSHRLLDRGVIEVNDVTTLEEYL